MKGKADYTFDTCITFPCEMTDFQNNPVTIYIMNDKGFGHHPYWIIVFLLFRKVVASCQVEGLGKGDETLWGPKSIVCKTKKGKEYCKLNAQVQYISFEDTIVHPNIDMDNLPDCDQVVLKFDQITVPVLVLSLHYF